MARKMCTKCGEVKEVEEFNKHCRNFDGLRSWCRACDNIDNAARYAANRARYRSISRADKLKNRYGISAEDFASLLSAQGEVCAVCRESCSTGRRLAVDHDHATGEVRGLLCNACNAGLSRFRDDPILLDAAAQYLRTPTARHFIGVGPVDPNRPTKRGQKIDGPIVCYDRREEDMGRFKAQVPKIE